VRQLDVKTKSRLCKSALGAALTAICGLVLWKAALGEAWVNASYDYLFRFGGRAVTNNVTLILMDNDAYDYFHQERGQPWDRALHTTLLQRLAADGAALVVFDCFFQEPREAATDRALAEAMRHQRVVLMAEQAEMAHPAIAGARPTLPAEPFLSASGTNWGVAWLCPDFDEIVRRHWPFPAPGPYPSLPWTAARLAGAILKEEPQQQWLRYYGSDGAWTRLGYRFAFTQPTNYFRNRIVFIGNQPKGRTAGGEPDRFRTPYTRWTGEAVGGVEILATACLNLVNGDWLRRPAWWVELLALVAAGTLLGGVLCQARPLAACVAAVAAALIVALVAVCGSHFTNYWFSWLVISGGQLPCALVFALATQKFGRVQAPALEGKAVLKRMAGVPQAAAAPAEDRPDTPGYELVHPPFGRGTYGKVWLARNSAGQWQALKVVYLATFNHDPDPYDREFNGVCRYRPISDKHPGLLRVDFVSQKRADYFYYVMELGDPMETGWEREPSTYKPRDLVSHRTHAKGRRLPVRECLRIGLALSETLAFLHQQGLTHRDIKPQNIIFVDGQPKLADVGLVAEIRPPDETGTYVGTPGYMPPPPEHPGTPQADIYALGMVLYVLSTGQNAALFPVLSTTLANGTEPADFIPLNTVILKACEPDRTQRYASAAELHSALQTAQLAIEEMRI
jgi:CHASE2 domain-containing sensor protein